MAFLFIALCAASAAASPLAYVPIGDEESPDSPTGVAIVDVATGARVGTIPLSAKAFTIAINPAGTRAYVGDDAGVAVIDLKTRTVVKNITGVGGGDVAIDPARSRVYVANENTNKLDVIDTGTNALITSIPVATQPRAVVVDAAGTRAYTGNTATPYSISVVDLATDTDIADVKSANLNRPENLGIAPSGAKVYAANFGAGAGGTTLGVLDPADNSVGSITVGTTPTGVIVNPSGTRAYVADRDSQSLSIIDTASSTNIGTVSLTFSPEHIGITPDGTRALITGQLSTGDYVDAVFDLVAGKVVIGPNSLPAANNVAIAPAEQPVPNITVRSAVAERSTRFDATASLGGPVVRYDWNFGDGKRALNGGSKIVHTYAKPGTYAVRLTETDGCAADAVFGALGVSTNGHSLYCSGSRIAVKTARVRVVSAPIAVAVVRTTRASVAKNGLAHLSVGCVKSRPCTGTVVLRTAGRVSVGRASQKRRLTLGSATFKSIPAHRHREVTVKLSRTGLAVLRSLGKLKATATATAKNPGAKKQSRTSSLTLRFV